MLKVWSEDERLYMDYEDEDEFFLVKKAYRILEGGCHILRRQRRGREEFSKCLRKCIRLSK